MQQDDELTTQHTLALFVPSLELALLQALLVCLVHGHAQVIEVG